jgi:hypothetical protein
MIPLWAICSMAILWSAAMYVIGRRSAQRIARIRYASLERMIGEFRMLLKPSVEGEE